MKKVSAEEIQGLLHTGEVNFTFKKVNGTIREANGTLVPGVIDYHLGYESEPNYTSDPSLQVYFDLDKKAFRSFRRDTEITLVGYKKLYE